MTEETIATNSVKLNIRPPKPHIMVYIYIYVAFWSVYAKFFG